MPEHESTDPIARAMDRSIFEVQGRTYTLKHVLSAAEFGGWSSGFWTELTEALSCASYAADEGFEIDMAELQSAADRFRYQRSIVTAEETERWLAERDLSEDEMVGYLERAFWHRRFSRQVDQVRGSYLPDAAAMAGALWPELIFSGRLELLAIPLARRVAAAAAEEGPGSAAVRDGLAAGLRAKFFERAGCGPEGLEGWLSRARCTAEWFHELLTLEVHYMRACDNALSPERSRAALDARRLDLIRLRFQSARFPAMPRAREAYLCITDDGEDYEEAVRRAGMRIEEQALLLEDAPELLRTHLLSAAPGAIVLIAEPGNEPAILRITEKTLPMIADPEVLRRLTPALISQYFDPLVEEHVRWTLPLEQACE